MDFLQGIVQVTEPLVGVLSDLEKEIETYLGMTSQRKAAADILEFWCRQSGELKQLSILARKFLAVPATSLLSEQFFSHTGDIQTDRRNRLSPDMVRMLSYLHLNADVDTIMGLSAQQLKQPLATLKTLKRHQMERRLLDDVDEAGPSEAVEEEEVEEEQQDLGLPQEREYLVGEVDVHTQGDMVELMVDNIDDVIAPGGNLSGDIDLDPEDLEPVAITFG